MDHKQAVNSAKEVLVNGDKEAAKRLANYVLDLPTHNEGDRLAVIQARKDLDADSNQPPAGEAGVETATAVAGTTDAG